MAKRKYHATHEQLVKFFEESQNGSIVFDAVSYSDFIEFCKEHHPTITFNFGDAESIKRNMETLRQIAAKLYEDEQNAVKT